MPAIKLDRLVSVSSEDKKFPAANLLGAPGSGKWKSATAGEKQLSAILQFKNPSKISSIHIGNEGSAFVEVMVAKESASSTKPSDEWKVMLVASSLMTPADARSNINLQKVRMFNSDLLSKSNLQDSWDRVKIVCTQPFNKSQAFGLSFISFITDEEHSKESEGKSSSGSQKLGAFTLKDDTDSDDPGTPASGSMFSDRARLQASLPPPTAAAAVRAAARDADKTVGVKHSVASSDSDDSEPFTVGKKVARSKPSRRAAPPTESESPKSKAVKVDSTSARKATSTSTSKAASTTASKTSSIPASKTDVKSSSKAAKPEKLTRKTDTSSSAGNAEVPLKEVMKGVVFSLSGFKNPKRGDLREKAIEMGAKYSPDWDKKCSHLVCAFTTTPKFSQVDGKGYIVGEDWILDSHKQKKKLSWRDYRLGHARTPPRAKEDEERDKSNSSSDVVQSKTSPAAAVKDDDYAGSTDVDSDAEDEHSKVDAKAMDATQVDSDATEVDSMDTDDEIAAHVAKGDESKSKGKSPASGKAAVVKQSNGSSAPSTSAKRDLPVLPDYLLDKCFFLYGNVNHRHSVYRYIHAYGGQVEDYMCDEVKYVITDDSWDDNFDSALNDNDNLIFVKSKWILDIHYQQKFIPHQKYAIVPS